MLSSECVLLESVSQHIAGAPCPSAPFQVLWVAKRTGLHLAHLSLRFAVSWRVREELPLIIYPDCSLFCLGCLSRSLQEAQRTQESQCLPLPQSTAETHWVMLQGGCHHRIHRQQESCEWVSSGRLFGLHVVTTGHFRLFPPEVKMATAFTSN